MDSTNPTEAEQTSKAGEDGSAGAGDAAQSSNEKDADIERLREETKSLNDQLLRAMADLENVRRRSRQEREEVAQFGLQDFLADLLPVVDNFERALSAEAKSVDSLLEGINVTLRQFHDALRKHGVEAVPGVGQPFDAKHHEAIMRSEPSEEFPAGTVSDELRRGYTLRGRLLRPSLVKVSQEE
jgi:molecular chaperone GrpE